MIADRLGEIRAAIDAARLRSAEPERAITLVAVTKNQPASLVAELLACGVSDFGENRVREARKKAAQVQAAVSWHMIGHLQRNKAKRAAGLFSCIHSVDRPGLVTALARTEAALDIFLQINVSGEETKFGARPENARELWQTALRAESLRVLGLMTMAPFAPDPEAARPVFRDLRLLRDELNGTGDGPPLLGLSMGMSGDFSVAVEEGATHVRIGTALAGKNPHAGS